MTRLFVAVVLTTRAVRRPLNLAVGCAQMDAWSPKTRPRTWTGALKVLPYRRSSHSLQFSGQLDAPCDLAVALPIRSLARDPRVVHVRLGVAGAVRRS